jgi:hypothetical protein
MATGHVDEVVPPPAGKCRFCGEDTWRSESSVPSTPAVPFTQSRTTAGPVWRARRQERPAAGDDDWAPPGPAGAAGAGLPVARSPPAPLRPRVLLRDGDRRSPTMSGATISTRSGVSAVGMNARVCAGPGPPTEPASASGGGTAPAQSFWSSRRDTSFTDGFISFDARPTRG